MFTKEMDRCDTKCGEISLTIKDIMDSKNMSVSQMSRISGLKFEVVQNYYNNKIHIYNGYILAKFCYYLDVAVSDLIIYTSCKEK